MKCFYHADLDGHASGAIVKWVYPECEMIEMNYGDDFPFATIDSQETIFMVDFTLQPFYEMGELQGLCRELIWIDHHQTAFEEAYKYKFASGGIVRIGTGACALTWEFFFLNDPIPEAIRLLADYDVWNHFDPKTLPFQYGFRFFEDTRPTNQELWKSFLVGNDRVEEVVQVGTTLLTYEDRQNQKYCKTFAFETFFGDLSAICINKGMTNSKIFDSAYDPTKHDIMVTFCRVKLPAHQWTVGLYTTKEDVDCGSIAKKFGGGGHRKAAGFQCAVLPFEY